MKKGLLALIVLTLTGLLFLTVGVLTAADMPDKITVNTEGYKKDKKGSVEFSHMKHSSDYGVACSECHHEYTDGKNTWKQDDPVKKCAECHDANENQGEAKKLMTAFHKNCKDCHKEAVKEGKKAPTSKCNDCHSKK